MKTAYVTGPGFYAAESHEGDPQIPPNVVRVHCIRMEAYDLIGDKDPGMEVSFEVLFAMAERDPKLARYLIKLYDAIAANRPLLNRIAHG